MTGLQSIISEQVEQALAEDIGDGDITASLIHPDTQLSATVITREEAIICGQNWVNEVFRQLDPSVILKWKINEGALAEANSTLFQICGPAQTLLTGERTALNFLQFMSGISTQAYRLKTLVSHTDVSLLDTRKTIPLHRQAQKYAVRCGGCDNHRMGLFDAFLIKENHIAAYGGVEQVVHRAKSLHPGMPIQIEVENETELEHAVNAGADIVMLDNFSLEAMREAVLCYRGKTLLEASGGIDEKSLVAIAETGIDRISIGSLTKHCRAVDLSMRFDQVA